jgi:hypothetical protein
MLAFTRLLKSGARQVIWATSCEWRTSEFKDTAQGTSTGGVDVVSSKFTGALEPESDGEQNARRGGTENNVNREANTTEVLVEGGRR